MIDDGYAAVTYRAVAAKAGVTPALVQYYFPTLDDMFVAAIRRRAERNLEQLVDRLATRQDEPLRVIWEFSRTHGVDVEGHGLAVTPRSQRGSADQPDGGLDAAGAESGGQLG